MYEFTPGGEWLHEGWPEGGQVRADSDVLLSRLGLGGIPGYSCSGRGFFGGFEKFL